MMSEENISIKELELEQAKTQSNLAPPTLCAFCSTNSVPLDWVQAIKKYVCEACRQKYNMV